MATDDDEAETEGQTTGDELSADIGETRIPVQDLHIYIQNKRVDNHGFTMEFTVSL